MLYRLDYLNDDGSQEPVRDPILGGDFICRHMTTARARATTVATRDERRVQITRIVGAGSMKATLVIGPDGTATRPSGTRAVERENCTRATDDPCFCTACRADRREARKAAR